MLWITNDSWKNPWSSIFCRKLHRRKAIAIQMTCQEEFITEMEEVEKEIDIHKAAEALDPGDGYTGSEEKEILRLRYGLTDGKRIYTGGS